MHRTHISFTLKWRLYILQFVKLVVMKAVVEGVQSPEPLLAVEHKELIRVLANQKDIRNRKAKKQ